MIRVVARTHRGREYIIIPSPNTVEHVAAVMERITCGNAKNARYFLNHHGSYTASGKHRVFYRAERVK